ncbi:hypothetical protein HOA92_06595 [archaeon]|jgi:uncharacterized protein|nr:hypothetical protein [archaeon]MBT6762680.1 hypothetical protein [archaeon]
MVSKFQKFVVCLIFLCLVLTLCSSLILASPYDERHIELLAVQTLEDGTTVGKSADLFLELREGSGRVFLDTTPLTKIDTQASTRYAKDIACDYFSLNCDRYDFFYTIRSDTAIIGGPSAGSATAALTAIAVMDLEHNEAIAVTGTINSGGTVGPVGGVKSKIEAAADENLDGVLVPLGALSEIIESDSISSTSEESNVASWSSIYPEYFPKLTSSPELNLRDYSEYVLGISSTEVVDLSDMLFELTGENYTIELGELKVDESYIEIMKGLDDNLCFRSESLLKQLEKSYSENLLDIPEEVLMEIESRENVSVLARLDENFYASASACFGLNVYLNYQIYENYNLTPVERSLLVEKLAQNVSYLQQVVESEELLTISDLQTKMVVKERLREAGEYMEIALSENSSYALSYANERLMSAITWMEFFEMDGKELDISLDALQLACHAKILEAEERYRYATLFFSGYDIGYIGEKINVAQDAWEAGDFELCLVQAAQAKAESSSIVSSIGLGTVVPEEYLVGKEEAALRTLLRNTKEGQFPILGYSYYLFAENLKSESPYSALLYYEYALEMSELNMYFPEASSGLVEKVFSNLGISLDSKNFINGFLQGLLFGVLIMWLYMHRFRKHRS